MNVERLQKLADMTDNIAPYLERLSSTQCDFLVWCIKRYDKERAPRINRGTLPFVSRQVAIACLSFKWADDTRTIQNNSLYATGNRFIMNLISILEGPSTLPY